MRLLQLTEKECQVVAAEMDVVVLKFERNRTGRSPFDATTRGPAGQPLAPNS